MDAENIIPLNTLEEDLKHVIVDAVAYDLEQSLLGDDSAYFDTISAEITKYLDAQDNWMTVAIEKFVESVKAQIHINWEEYCKNSKHEVPAKTKESQPELPYGCDGYGGYC